VEKVDGDGLDVVGVGRRVRAQRIGLGLSLEELAGVCKVSRSMLSEVERGGRTPTVLVLDRIATGLGTTLGRLLREPVAERRVVLRSVEQDVAVDPAGWERRVLSPVLAGVEFEFMRTTIGAGVDAGVFSPHAPGSREYLAVERGRLSLVLDDEGVDLAAGDSIYYAGDCRHGYRNPGRGTCVYYLAMDVPARSGHTVVSSS
jgi:transcriptional regulator with XRE-family HTH domain